jgi:hypothetical protein
MMSKMIAPITAVMIEAIKPEPMLMPRAPASQPPITAPIISHDNVAYEAEPAALDQQASEPTCDRTDDQPNDDAIRAHSCLHLI